MSANAAWAAYKVHQNPSFFAELASKQAPSIREFTLPQLLIYGDSLMLSVNIYISSF